MTRGPSQYDRINTWDRVAIALVLAVMIAFGWVVVLRSALQKERKTDFDVFARAAWAVRQGEDVYATFSERGWNYVYPSFFSILVTPLADPPTKETFETIGKGRATLARSHGVPEWEVQDDQARLRAEGQRVFGAGKLTGGAYLPFWLSCAIWYLLSLGMVLGSAHLIALAIERTTPALSGLRPGDRGWWTLRLWPVIFCAPGLFNGLSRGQSDALVLLAIAMFVWLLARGRSFLGGSVLAVAAAVKIIPGLIFLVPIWRRDWRAVGGILVGSAICLLIIPALVLGPTTAWEYNVRWLQVMGLPGLGVAGSDTSRKFELYGLAATESQSLLTVLHNIVNIRTPRGLRPEDAAAWTKPVVLAFSAAAVLVTLWAARWRRPALGGNVLTEPAEVDRHVVGFTGLLLAVMLMVSPVTHTHYFGFVLPLVAWLVSLQVARHPRQSLFTSGWVWGGLYVVAHALPRLPGLDVLQDLGVMLWVGIGVWAAGCLKLRERTEPLRWE